MVGSWLGEYECIDRLGSGGMADVYLARRRGAEGFRKLFALKVIGGKANRDPDFQRMFMREAKISATLTHANIAQVVDFGLSEHDFYLVMEYVDGPTVQHMLKAQRGSPLPLAVAISIAVSLCAALDHVHESAGPGETARQLVHRDVSPSNVLISRAGSVKLVDFGIAKPIGAASGGTTTGVLKGKVGYMAPEQVRGEPLDRRCDIFALGIVLYEMTTGRRCFYADSMFEVLNLSARAEIISPREHVAEYPEDLERIVIRALARDADGRFATAAELQEALEDFALAHRLKISSRIVSEFLSEAMPQNEAAVRRARGAAEPESPTATALIPSTEDEHDPSAPLGVGNTEPRARGSARGWVTAAAILAAGVTGWVLAADRSAPRSVRPLVPPVPYAAALPQASVAAVPELKTPLPPEASAKPATAEAVPTPKAGHRKKKRQKRPTRANAESSPRDRDAILPPSARPSAP